jgi:hypothetical protein
MVRVKPSELEEKVIDMAELCRLVGKWHCYVESCETLSVRVEPSELGRYL